MNNTLSKTLGLGLPALAEMIRAKGRGKDTVLAHITPKEAALLKKRGGAGTINPHTGLLEYYDGEDDYYFPDEFPTMDVPTYDVPMVNDGGSYIPNDVSYMDNRDVGQVENTYNYPTSSDFISTPQYDTQYPQSYYEPLGRPEPVYQDAVDFSGNRISAEEQRALGQEAQALAKAGEQKYPGLDSTQIDRLNEIARSQGVYAEGDPFLSTGVPTPAGSKTKDGKDSDYSNLLSQLLRLGLGAGTAYALSKGVAQPAAKKAEDQAQQAKNERMGIAAPYQGIGKGLIAGAQAGNLSASNIQAVKAARAMAAQNISRTGGVGVLQGANSIADLEARLLDNQLIQGIKIANIGDNYAINAIQAGMAADNALAASQADFAKQLGVLLAPMVLGYSPNLPSGTPGTGIRQSTGALDAIANAGSDLLTGGGNYTNSLPTQRGEI
jgi:hypothetical protein